MPGPIPSHLLVWLAASAAGPPVAVLWNDPADYPWEARLREQRGDVGLVLSLTAEGEIQGCSVTESSGIASLDSGSCALLTTRKWFPPARNSPAPGPLRQAVLIHWRLRPFAKGPIDYGGAWPIEPKSWARKVKYPGAPGRSGREGRVQIAFDITERGRVENCTILGSSGSPKLDAATCRHFTERARFIPAGEVDNAPRRTRATGVWEWRLDRE